MNFRERTARALRGERTDRTPLAYLFLGGARHVLGLLSDFIADPPSSRRISIA